MLLTPEGKAIHGDYDMQGVYRKLANGPGYAWVDTNDKLFLKELNEFVCGGEPMIKHGSNDDFLKMDEFGNKVPGRPSDPQEDFLVIDRGQVLEIGNLEALRQFFIDKEIIRYWIY